MTLKDVELRKLPAAFLCNIATILETNSDWKKVMSLIPRNPRSEHFEPKYSNEHIKQIEDHARIMNRKCADLLFEEWGTSGRIRPTLGTLKEIVQKAQVFRAADELAYMLQETVPTRPDYGPAALINTNISLMISMERRQFGKKSSRSRGLGNRTTAQMKTANDDNLVKYPSCSELPKISALQTLGDKTTAKMKSESDLTQFSDRSLNIPNISGLISKTQSRIDPDIPIELKVPNEINKLPLHDIDSGIIKDSKLIHFPYRELEAITKRFSERILYDYDASNQVRVAGKIGSGGFGEVFVGYHPNHGHLAIKKTHVVFDSNPKVAIRVFNSEVTALSHFRHEYIVPIIGYSRDGPSLCIVCDYIPGGSLESKLAAKTLTEKQRINIMIGTAEGLRYLHTKKYTLSNEFASGSDANKVKVNFVHRDVKSANILLTRDLVPKLCDFGLARDGSYMTTQLMGSLAYMPPEGFTGNVTQKTDIYSFGIVLLELLTGLKSLLYIQGDQINIKDYIEENCPGNELTANFLDPFIDKWTKAKEIYSLAKWCLERDRKNRPTAEQLCEALYKIRGVEIPPSAAP